MPGLWGLLNHSLERSFRFVSPVTGLLIVSPAAHMPCFCADCLWWRPMFARSRGLRNATPRHSGARVLHARTRNPEVVYHFWIPGSLAKGERPGMTGDEA